MLSIQSYGSAALKLLENGYTPIPIIPETKKPSIKNWQNIENDYNQIEKLSSKHPHAGVGVLLNDLIVFDIDILDDRLSLLVKKIIINELKDTIERIGKFPKRALFYRRIGEEFRKKSTESFDIEKGKARLEILATGSQCVVFGTHPETKQPYQWIEDSVLDTQIQDLPSVNIRQVENIITQTEILLRNHVETKEVVRPIIKTSISENKKKEGLNDNSLIRSAVRHIDPEDYDTWIKIGLALKKCFKDEGFEIFDNWSKYKIDGSPCPNYQNKDFNKEKWNSFNPEKIDKIYIFKLATQNGWQGGSFFEIESNTHTSVAKYLKKQFELDGPIPVYDEGELWRYNGLCWEIIPDSELRKLVHELDQKKTKSGKLIQVSKQFIDGCLHELTSMCSQPRFFEEQPLGVNCKNGFLEILYKKKPKLLKHDPNHKQRFVIDARWKDEDFILSGYLKKLINGCFSGLDEIVKGQLIRVIQQILGVSITGIATKLSTPICFVLYGPTATNGKSQILELIRSLLPKDACSSIPPADLGKEQYLIELVGKMANLSDELSGANAIRSDKLKAVVTGDTVSGKRVYKPVCSFKPNAIHIFATNILPNFKGGVDEGINRRVKVIPFDRTIPVDERIPRIAEKIVLKEKDQLFKFAIEGAIDVIENKGFLIPDTVEQSTAQWFEDSDSILYWCKENHLHDLLDKSKKVSLTEAYSAFKKHMEEIGDGEYVPSRSRFVQRIRQFVRNDVELEMGRDKHSNFIRRKQLVY
jgi:P4 family phage/plasmid primase-like protien